MILTRTPRKKPVAQTMVTAPATGRNWLDWQTCAASDLGALIAEAAAAGFDAVRMIVQKQPPAYRVGFQRKPATPELWPGIPPPK